MASFTQRLTRLDMNRGCWPRKSGIPSCSTSTRVGTGRFTSTFKLPAGASAGYCKFSNRSPTENGRSLYGGVGWISGTILRNTTNPHARGRLRQVREITYLLGQNAAAGTHAGTPVLLRLQTPIMCRTDFEYRGFPPPRPPPPPPPPPHLGKRWTFDITKAYRPDTGTSRFYQNGGTVN